MKRGKGYYSISVVAKMFNVHQQTIRMYEKEGLLDPERTPGGTRLFSEEDVDRLEEIINLTHKMGINIAGVEMILRLQRKIKKLQDDMNKLFERTQSNLSDEQELLKTAANSQAQQLLAYRTKEVPSVPALPEKKRNRKIKAENKEKPLEDWQIDYEDK